MPTRFASQAGRKACSSGRILLRRSTTIPNQDSGWAFAHPLTLTSLSQKVAAEYRRLASPGYVIGRAKEHTPRCLSQLRTL